LWKCTNCHHIELTSDKPEHCPVCGAEAAKLVPHEVPGVKGMKTLKHLKDGFVAESQAHQRNIAFAMKADMDGYRQVARLFRAIRYSGEPGKRIRKGESSQQHLSTIHHRCE